MEKEKYTMNIHGIKKGDTVLVDCDYANGGYEATVIEIGRVVATIKAGNTEWDIVISRLKPKQ